MGFGWRGVRDKFINMEEFRTIPSFPDYSVSNKGRVKTNSRRLRYTHAVTGHEHFRICQERLLKVQYNIQTGYKFNQLYRGAKMYNKPVHQLVADAFLPKVDGLDYINHIDGNKHNNTVENLERCTNEYNHEHATKTGLKPRGSRIATAKLNERSVEAIKNMVKDGVSHGQIAKWFNVSRSNISLIAEGKTWQPLAEELAIEL